ncbi:LysR family transcriptional regulator [Marinobacter sp. NP-4(2019)]|uniref:LysR family transcriptional regulator n=1 Tax=Marinobacter sp. NP-4(2019) TaxID=2488665 RepID=UPI000FC3ED6E|nr:LysR family transcriptional regulator [Marinobacter sp. NP-4(2019)]AZT85472.1 LysR family transcriptional regulator [Marinobacter sp. NP-4(2019)]
MLTLKQLRHLQVVIRHGSIKRAAEILHVTPPALTRSLNLLEDDLGVQLFDRSKNGMQATEFCLQIRDRCARLLSDIEDLVHEANLYRNLESGRINLGIGRAIRDFVLRPVLPDFVEQYPKIQIHISEGLPGELIDGLKNRQFDVVIAGSSGLDEIEGLSFQCLKSVPSFIVARRGHPLENHHGTSLADLFDYPMLAATELVATHPMRQFLSETSGKTPEVHILSSDYELLKEILQRTDAWIPVPTPQFAADVEAGELTVLDVPDWKFNADIRAIELAGRARSPAVAQFVEHCMQRVDLW